jgi:hypothetical protein
VELAAKYHLVHEDADGARPDFAVFPRLFVPTQAVAPRHLRLLLPLWAGKSIGPWYVFGGGGFLLNPGQDQRHAWETGVNLGVTWLLAEHWSVLASGGRGIQNARQKGDYSFYLAIKYAN